MDGLITGCTAAILFVLYLNWKRQKKVLRRLKRIPDAEDIIGAINNMQLIVHISGGNECEICGGSATTMLNRGENTIWLCDECLQEQSEFRGWE